MLLPFDVGIIYLLDVNKCTHLVTGGIHSTFLEILLLSATEQVTGERKNINKRKIIGRYFHFNRSRQLLQTFVNYENINKENAVRGILSHLHPRITHYNRIIIEYNG